ncbi:hypothetical protein TL16_g06436 [Triparma laevis f. inornata]|uniref:Uncharacterized protein n=1 Tax=Triparma laevis f. inornata TaxID=1714386 RepID=A0A9W7AND3_9STRA|nr:hypothetical protein TL16_g06436 [Triparma laevis f. inornata]
MFTQVQSLFSELEALKQSSQRKAPDLRASSTVDANGGHLAGNLTGGVAATKRAHGIHMVLTLKATEEGASDEDEVLAARGVFDNPNSRLVRALLYMSYMSYNSRVYLVPAFVVGASAALLLSNDFTSQSILLDGMAVGFASNVDDMISFIVISEEERQRVEEKVEKIVADEAKREKGWKRSCVYGLVLAVSLIVAAICCEELMPWFGNEGGNEHALQQYSRRGQHLPSVCGVVSAGGDVLLQ